MRRLASTALLVLLALVVPATASAATGIVKIDASGYHQQSIRIAPGDTVDWQYDSTCALLTPCNHGVQFDDSAAPICPGPGVGPTDCGSRQFPDAGRFRYYDPED